MSNTLQQITSVGAVKTTVTLDLGDCDKAYRGATFDVWVTPTRAHWAAWVEWYAYDTQEPQRISERRKEIAATNETTAAEYAAEQSRTFNETTYRMLDAWLAETWVNIPADEVTTIRETLQEQNPAAWQWLLEHTLRAITQYRENLSKN